ncbi:putative exonuclease GOR [Nannospalax galili]|uniref:putative exonuclease GOR n=1 Tax=Nannospalax galili TaxID=1026970 RepID=UPI0004ED2ADC|nr:putative exonuclease GOR [Nannospalax galili]
MSLKATAPSWFPPGFQEAPPVVAHPVLDVLLPCYQLAQGGPLEGPAMYCQPPRFIVIHADSSRPDAAVRPGWPTASWEPLFWRPQQVGRKPVCVYPRRVTLSSDHASAAGEKRRLIHVASPGLACIATGAKKTLSTPRKEPWSLKPAQASPDLCAWSRVTSRNFSDIPEQMAYSCAFYALIARELKDKVPVAMRQHYLGLFTQECLRFSSSHLEAIEKAQAEEKVVYDRSPSKHRYLSMALNRLKKLRGLVPSAIWGLSQAALYSCLRSYLLTEDQRRLHGYPFPHPDKPGTAVLFTAEPPESSSSRICCRCGTRYPVSSSGRCECSEQCIYHWGRPLSTAVGGSWEIRFTCCSGGVDAVGCRVAKRHVQDGRKDNLQGFAKTFPKKHWEAHPGIYALDCEMSYTTHGLELTRVTVVDTELRVVYDTFVKPDNEIVDYNTMFSGVTEADLANTNVRLRDVQAVLLGLFSSDTILIGHSLESDLLALKFIHSMVVDTSVLFPHYRGLPFKRSLRGLSAHYLNQMIQANSRGHCSGEDACACMRLVIWKMQEDAKSCGLSSPQYQASSEQCDPSQKLPVLSRSPDTGQEEQGSDQPQTPETET